MKRVLIFTLILLPLLVFSADLSVPQPRDCAKKVAIDNCNLRITYRVKLGQDTVGGNIFLTIKPLK